MRIDGKRLDSFLNEVRSCTDCKTEPCKAAKRCTPFIYGKPTSDILVISENPPIRPWRDNIGTLWKETLDTTNEGEGVPSKIARWLGILEEADKRFFWIQRANCFPTGPLDETWIYCSNKYISEAITLVKPRLILTLGGVAASYFRKFHSLKDLSQRCLEEKGLTVTIENNDYKWVVLSHPSWRGNAWRQKNAELHKGIVRLTLKLI